MNLAYAVDRLYQIGWTPMENADLETLPDGRKYPSPRAVQLEFAEAGLELSIQHKPTFHCYRATWSPAGETPNPTGETDERHGTVVGACRHEAAVYALAQLRAAEAEHSLAAATA